MACLKFIYRFDEMTTRKTILINLAIAITCLSVFISSCKKEEETIDCTGSTPTYAVDVKPLVNGNCLTSGCHDAGSKNGDYTTYKGLQTVAMNGTLEKRVVTEKTMPPMGALSLADRKKIKCWVLSGASDN